MISWNLPKDGERKQRFGEEDPQALEQVLLGQLIVVSPVSWTYLILNGPQFAKEDVLEPHAKTDGYIEHKVGEDLYSLACSWHGTYQLTIKEPLLRPTETAAAKKFGRVLSALPTTAAARPHERIPYADRRDTLDIVEGVRGGEGDVGSGEICCCGSERSGFEGSCSYTRACT